MLGGGKRTKVAAATETFTFFTKTTRNGRMYIHNVHRRKEKGARERERERERGRELRIGAGENDQAGARRPT